MKPSRRRALGMGLLVLAAASGCLFESQRPLHYLGDSELKYYKDRESEIDYAAVCPPPNHDAIATGPPRTIYDRRHDAIWDMTLIEALHLSLANNRVLLTAGTFTSPGNPLYTNPNFIDSVYDPAIQASGVLFGGRGVEAALADFDTQFTTSMIWGRDERIQNSAFGRTGLIGDDVANGGGNGAANGGNGVPPLQFGAGGVGAGRTLVEETAMFNSRLEKQFAYGATFGLNHNWNYLGTNSPGVLFPSSYTGSLSADYRQPLWAGFGTAFTRTAGPLRGGFAAITGVSQGVVIARINNDITIADFEAAVRNQLKDVEDTYWFLYLAYRDYDTAVAARDATLRIWERTKEIIDVGGLGALPGGLGPAVTPADEAQARDQYFFARAAAERALNTIYEQELRLRRLLGLPVNDGKVIRPVTEPITAEFIPDWYVCLAEALTQRVELRRQKWQIKSLELQLAAAKSLTNPRLDLVGNYRVNAFGDQLLGESDDDEAGTVQGLDSAYETLTQGDQTGWMLGFEFSMPIGFRQAHAQVRNYELRLAKARDVLATQEREISHELAFAIQDLVVEYQTARTNLSRREAARRRVELFQIQVDEGEDAQDELLRALQSLAEAESAYFSSLVGYQQAIAQLEFFKGTLLEWNNVHLAEGPWNPKAYQQALQRAMARSHAMPAPWLETEPHEFELPGPPQIHLPAHVPPGSVIPEEPRHPPEQAPPPAPKPPAAPDLPPGGDVTGNVRLYD